MSMSVSMSRRSVAMLAAMLLALSMMAGSATAQERGRPGDLHCANHQSEAKVDVPSGWDFGADGPYVAVVSVYDTTTEEYIDVTVTVDGKTVTFSSDDHELEDVEFCIKGGPNNTGPLSGLTGNTDTIPNRGGQTPDISYVVVYSVTTVDQQVVECGEGLSVSGGFEIFEGTIEMGQSSGEFEFYYRGINQPDWFELYYEGERIFDVVSGTQANNPVYDPLFEEGGRFFGATERESLDNNTRLLSFGDENSTSTQLTLRVTGSEPGTLWEAVVNCPIEEDED
jgi:hypothetical protein